MARLQCLIALPEGRIHAPLILSLEHVDADTLLNNLILLGDAVIPALLFQRHLGRRPNHGVIEEGLTSRNILEVARLNHTGSPVEVSQFLLGGLNLSNRGVLLSAVKLQN